MSYLFFKAAGFTSSRDLPQLSGVEPLILNLENKAYGHWLFGGGAQSLADKVNSRALTPISGATVAPVYIANAVNLSSAIKNGLLSGLQDTASQDVTMCAVVKVPNIAVTTVLGNLVVSGDTTTSGAGIFVLSNKVYVSVKPTTGAPVSGGVNSLSPDMTIDYAKPFFIAFSLNKALKKVTLLVSQSGVTKSAEATFTASYIASLNNFAVGNSVYATGTTTAEFYEAIVFDSALSLAEITDIALRSKTRLTDRNVSF